MDCLSLHCMLYTLFHIPSTYGLVMNSNFPFSGPSLHCMLCFTVIASTYGLVMKFYLTYIEKNRTHTCPYGGAGSSVVVFSYLLP